MKLFTIGHSNHSIEKFIRLLEDNCIMTLVNVRSAPFSRYNPQFNKENLENTLSGYSIEYAYAGKYLGGRPSDPACYKNRELPLEGIDYLYEVNYLEVMKRPWFIQGIIHLLELVNEQTTVIMCSEEDPAECHRHHLIAQYIMMEHPEVNVQHIRGDGIVYNAHLIQASVNNQSAKQLSLFREEQ